MVPELKSYQTYIVSYSGDDNSTATLLWALEHLPSERIKVCFCNTTVEWPETYRYLKYIERKLGVRISRVQAGDRPLPKKRDGTPRPPAAYAASFFEMVRMTGRWPGPGCRFCSTYLKKWPRRLYARQFTAPVLLEGSRVHESNKRTQYSSKSALPVYRPLFSWSTKQVRDYLRAAGVSRNPVYKIASRCGCWCCTKALREDVFNFCRLYSDRAWKAVCVERDIGQRWAERESIEGVYTRAQRQMLMFEPGSLELTSIFS